MQKNIELIFKYYTEGKLSEYTFCSELEDYLDSGLRTRVTLASDLGGVSSSFVVALLPIKTDAGYKVEYILDKKMIKSNSVTHEELIEAIDSLKYGEQKILSMFKEELKMIPDVDLTVRDTLAIYTKLYLRELDFLPSTLKAKLIEKNILKEDLVKLTLDKLMGFADRTDQIIEKIKVDDILPDRLIDEAERLVSHDVSVRIVLGDNEPSLNTLESQFDKYKDANKDFIQVEDIDMDKVLSKN